MLPGESLHSRKGILKYPNSGYTTECGEWYKYDVLATSKHTL